MMTDTMHTEHDSVATASPDMTSGTACSAECGSLSGDSALPQSVAARLCDLNVFFGKRQVLNGISFEAHNHAVTVLIGRSGSGKSTLLRTFNRLNECFAGCRTSGHAQVLLEGTLTDIHTSFPEPATLRTRVGMVFQTPDVLPVSIRRNMTLPLQHALGLTPPVVAVRVERALRDAGLWDEVCDRLDAPAETLSGGQQQRLCLARSLAMRPAMLLLDEPTASLDNVSSRTIEALLGQLKDRYPVIMVSHSLGQALRLADRLVLMGSGRILRCWDRQNGLPDMETLELMLEETACCE
ncbi:phosphate ABC transporter ATP-binding protein [Desulfovibrio subterraneus]|uniref:phosphate ABC transporter ATP-binding protein n=1 Tax=Desulfovibrio subterraneus TaxID=2718620 RepID=UPI0022B8D199|nr:phosphate ABC transporter ATP-binding protein [Desulfovibrio subterraneus]WBF67401.1 phosphate ABC transporter ATP-binding protein [Desulfovibrio subterraneus]